MPALRFLSRVVRSTLRNLTPRHRMATCMLVVPVISLSTAARVVAQQRTHPTANVRRWQLTFDMEQSWERVVTATAPSPSGPVTVSGKRSYRVTCSGSALLLPDQFGGFAGPVTSNCNYTAEGAVEAPWMRGTMSGRGVADTTEQVVGLGIDPDRGEYAFDIRLPAWIVQETTSGSVCQPPAVITPTSKCVWVPFTEVNTERATVESLGGRELPLPQGVTTLSGTNTNPPEDDPSAKRSVTWSFSPAGVAQKDSAVVTIEGPACACLDGEKVPGANITWSAKASRAGGSFGPFKVQSAGTPPRIVTNSRGATAARITLEPSRTTGPVKLTATYTLKGRATTATRDVEFCVLDSIRIGDGSRDMAFDDASPGNLKIQARSQAFYNGADASAELAWNFESIGAASTTTMTPASPVGGVVDVTYTGLPELNAAFGKKRIEVALDKGVCSCKRTDTFRAFYSPSATNHPPPAPGIAQGTTTVPNWFYYYAQTPAIMAVPGVVYDRSRFSARDNRPAIAQFDENDGNIYLTDLLWQTVCRPSVPKGGKPVAPSGAGNDGIDCVAESTRHEEQHRADWAAWWPNGYLIPADTDLDGVPLLVETARPSCSPVSPASCDERPFTDVGDREIFAYWVGWQWRTGSLNAQDWACGPKGKQWKGGYGCAE